MRCAHIPLKFILLLALLLPLGMENSLAQVDKDKSIGTGFARVLDVFFSGPGLSSAIKNSGLRGNSASQVEHIVKLSLKNLSGSENPTQAQVLSSLSVIRGGADGDVRKKLLSIFSKNEKDLTKGDFVEGVNALVYLAGRYGADSSLAIACSACVSDNLAKNGFKFSFTRVVDKQTEFILKNVVPQSPRKLKSFIQGRIKRLGLGAGTAKSMASLEPQDEKLFALFLTIPEHGTPLQKKLFESIREVSTLPNGQVAILSDQNPHRLWRLFGSDLSEYELDSWSKLLKEVSQDANTAGETSKEAAFFRYFERKAAKNSELEEPFEVLKRKNCFFKK